MKRFIIILAFPLLTSCDPWTMSLIAALGGAAMGYLGRDEGVVVKAPVQKVASPQELENRAQELEQENRALEVQYENKIEKLEQRMQRIEMKQKK